MNDDTRKFFEKLAGVATNENEEFEPQLARVETPVRASSKIKEVAKEKEKEKEIEDEDTLFDEGEGQLAIDVYQTTSDIVVESAIAGVSSDDLDIEISPEAVTIKGKRGKISKNETRDYLFQECYWGRFSRSVILPQEINPDHASAALKNGILRIVLPKVNRQRTKKVKVKFE